MIQGTRQADATRYSSAGWRFVSAQTSCRGWRFSSTAVWTAGARSYLRRTLNSMTKISKPQSQKSVVRSPQSGKFSSGAASTPLKSVGRGTDPKLRRQSQIGQTAEKEGAEPTKADPDKSPTTKETP